MLATMTAVAFVAHDVIGMAWAPAFVLGAIISPTDPLAAGLIMRGLDVPRRIVSAVEGEGLFNDATALVLLRTAIVATAASFSFWGAIGTFAYSVAVALVIGWAVGWLSLD